ncbi:MAG: hypothetical protein CL676_13715 [Bdellovibrionaceae bacterium]|nr:hypothetical protein [Pseudobdellovibrionaceae bacterium]
MLHKSIRSYHGFSKLWFLRFSQFLFFYFFFSERRIRGRLTSLRHFGNVWMGDLVEIGKSLQAECEDVKFLSTKMSILSKNRYGL